MISAGGAGENVTGSVAVVMFGVAPVGGVDVSAHWTGLGVMRSV